MKSRTVIFFLLIFILAGGQQCSVRVEDHYQINYNVINNAGSTLKIIFNGMWPGGDFGSGPVFKDTVVFVQSGEARTLMTCVNTRYDLQNPETGTELEAITELKIFIHDTILSSSNFLLTSYWEFQPLQDNRAELNLPVTPDDFNLK